MDGGARLDLLQISLLWAGVSFTRFFRLQSSRYQKAIIGLREEHTIWHNAEQVLTEELPRRLHLRATFLLCKLPDNRLK